ncbi:winged helix DNA-binding domain-containing protein [Lentinula detonsa]|uniref:Winged helix DNA-binding domain-containing protein n=1 Tax=Lentinula detonsa TaxID=2804962 RepID=A0A9W8P6F7_9AGAR|nr:winged helix DNA-binding domain-containing protein [Lentinula detonsa]
MPAPISRISVALDPTVYYLLGQLEYYLSPQNLAQDFFLRQKMDSHGWIPIPLIASFNRVRQITTDESFVRDVLGMSSVVEIQGDMVRMKEGEWERFVLPGAQTSRVDSIHDFSLTPSSEEESEDEEEEEEEEEVVFVMG